VLSDLRELKGNSPYVAEFIVSTAIFGLSNLSNIVLPGGEYRALIAHVARKKKLSAM
jgi:hypothetical protein